MRIFCADADPDTNTCTHRNTRVLRMYICTCIEYIILLYNMKVMKVQFSYGVHCCNINSCVIRTYECVVYILYL